MRRAWVYLALVAVAVGLVFVLRERKRQFIAAQIVLLQSDDSEVATEARKRLQRVGRSAVRPVCALLEHEDEEARARAALTLANIGHPAACAPLMQAAKRGDFAAADALAFMNHPRAREARALARCRVAEKVMQELRLRNPIGGRSPIAPCTQWYPPHRPFGNCTRQVARWPEGQYGLGRWHRWPDDGAWTASNQYREAAELFPLPQALLGAARWREMRGHYGQAAQEYDRALAIDPTNEAARRGKAGAERLGAVARTMGQLVPRAYHVERIKTHATWRDGETTYWLAVTTWMHAGLFAGSVAPKLVLFRESEGRLEKCFAVSTYTPAELAKGCPRVPTYVDVYVTEANAPASVVAIRAHPRPPSERLRFSGLIYDLTVYRFESGALVPGDQLVSEGMPWVGDLDEDGDAEIVTWRAIGPDLRFLASFPRPVVHRLINGECEERTLRFPTLFEQMLAALGEQERHPERLRDTLYWEARIHEMLSNATLAAAAYERLERTLREEADRIERTIMEVSPGQGFREHSMSGRLRSAATDLAGLADVIKQRRLELEAEAKAEGQPEPHSEAQPD